MTWDHRVLRRYADINGEPTPFYTIHEVYYNSDGTVMGYIENEKSPYGESVDELRADCWRFMEACTKPVIDEKNLVKYFEELRANVSESGDSEQSNLH